MGGWPRFRCRFKPLRLPPASRAREGLGAPVFGADLTEGSEPPARWPLSNPDHAFQFAQGAKTEGAGAFRPLDAGFL